VALPSLLAAGLESDGVATEARLDALVRSEFAYVWRLCRRLGLPQGDADDAAQQVFLTAARRLGEVRYGSERAFLYGVALNVVAKWRTTHARRRETFDATFDSIETMLPSAEDLLTEESERRVLDALLDTMPDDLRTVFVLHEIEQQTAPRIAALLGVPVGTATSRLRRAREDFAARLARFRARAKFEGAKR
jgi:RNA polymerase sigma-70 factor, ECF subfamily